MPQSSLQWFRVLDPSELDEGRVTSVTVNHRSLAITHFEGRFSALDNRCPHQGGPLGEGSIERGWLRCPWHGWDYHPCTGKPPGGYDDGVATYPVEVRDDGVYVGLQVAPPRTRTISDVMVETMLEWGVTHVFGMVAQGVNSAAIFAALQRHVDDEAVLCVDVGNNTYSFGRYFECEQQSVLMSGYLGSIGFGYPAAMGAWAAAPKRQIVAITGDGGFGQYLAELTTAVKYGMPIKHVLLNNSELGKISKEQRAGQWDVWQTSLHNPDFAAFATGCGAWGIRIAKASQLDEAFARAFAHEGPAMVEILSDPLLV